jgi:fructosamine-3-kinase
MTVKTFVKRDAAAPRGFFGCEVAGLQWLSDVHDGARCARVIDYGESHLTLERVVPSRPTIRTAYEFGVRLARTHDAGAAAFGSPPADWRGPGFFGPLHQPLPMSYAAQHNWGEFYATARLAPMRELAAHRLDADTAARLDTVIDRCTAGDFDDDDTPARLHGDLWSGNLMWTDDGVVLIDPAAHGGHRETDLAMLALFGCPHLNVVIEGYLSVHPLRPGWQARLPLQQLYPLLAHVVLFGDGYAHRTRLAVSRVVKLS